MSERISDPRVDRAIDDEPWGVYEEQCGSCGLRIMIVATVHSVENGYAEAYEDLRCTVCKSRTSASLN